MRRCVDSVPIPRNSKSEGNKYDVDALDATIDYEYVHTTNLYLPCVRRMNSVTGVCLMDRVAQSVESIAVSHMKPRVLPLRSHIAVDAKNNLIYVANTHGDSVTVIDGSGNQVVATLPTGTNPYAMAVDVDSGAIFVANLGVPSFTRIDKPVSGTGKMGKN
ncbi:MAG: hypothetical protein WCD57_16435 [Acidobacteriaceae bacterium]